MAEDPRLDRLGKLLRLALHNPNEHEARSAALAAVRYMDEHKMVVTLLESAPRAEPPRMPPAPGTDFADYLRAVRRQQQDRDRADDWWTRPRR